MSKTGTTAANYKQYDFSAFDDGALRRAAQIKPYIKYVGFAGLGLLIFLSFVLTPLLITPGLLLLAIVLGVLYFICSQTPGDVFAEQNRLQRPFLKSNSNYYFLYKEYKEAADSALSKTSAVPWGLPIGKGELAIAFFHNLDVLVWGRLSKQFPHIVIDATGNNRFMGNNIDKHRLPLEQVSLEGDFPNYFKVYIEKGQQLISLQIVSPDRMATLVDGLSTFDLEIKGDHIKLYGVNLQKSAASMRSLVSVLQLLDEDLKIERLNKIRLN